MKIKGSIKIEILDAATGLLRSAIPELNAENLLNALRSYNPREAKSNADSPKPPYTVKQAMSFLQLSKPSVFKLINRGKLVRVKLSGATRITAESISRLVEERS